MTEFDPIRDTMGGQSYATAGEDTVKTDEPTGRFTNQQSRPATKADCRAAWGGEPNGKRFRCKMCGYRFVPGDVWRWVYGGKVGMQNLLVCERCDGPDILDRWVSANKELEERFWWAL